MCLLAHLVLNTCINPLRPHSVMKHGHPIEKALTMSLTEMKMIHIPAPVVVKDSEHWTELAACKGRTPLFFPPKAERPQARARREARARQLCDQCSVTAQCRQYARSNHEYGYWAGESEEDRHLAGFTVAAPIGIRARMPHSA